MTQIWRLIISPPAQGAHNMVLDEAILESAAQKSVPPTLRLYAWTPACISIGNAQPLAQIDLDRLQKSGWLADKEV